MTDDRDRNSGTPFDLTFDPGRAVLSSTWSELSVVPDVHLRSTISQWQTDKKVWDKSVC